MAFRATNVVPQRAYLQVKGTATNVKNNCTTFVAQMAASGANYSLLRDIRVFLANANAQFTTLAATPGLAAYAQQQEDDEAYDVVAEFAAMQAAINAALTWMNTNVPLSVQAVPPAQWTDNGPTIATVFTVAQTAGFRAQLTAVANSII